MRFTSSMRISRARRNSMPDSNLVAQPLERRGAGDSVCIMLPLPFPLPLVAAEQALQA
jgi:hypothetical protein